MLNGLQMENVANQRNKDLQKKNDNISQAHPLALIVTSPATHRGRRVRPAL